MCDNVIDEYSILMDKIRDLANRETPVLAVDIGSDGHERWQCPVCGAWWYGKNNYCHECGHKQMYN